MSRPSDRNLLFGIPALQMDFVAKSDLLEGMQAWLLNKDKTLGELLCERGVLSPENRSLLDPLVDAHIRQHGGEAQHSLAALSSDGGLVVELAHADDDELRHSLSLLPRHEPLLPREVGFPSSAALQEDHDGADQGESVAAGELPADQSPGELPAARFQETLIPGTLDQMDEPKLRFRILRPHAEGGLGRVHVALDQELNREVAFKEIKFEYARRKDAQSRFVIEAEVTGGLEHPGIVPVYGLGHFDDGRPFYAMRFIRGQSLLDAVRRFYGKASRDKSQPADAPASASAAQPTDKLPYASQREFRDLINRLIDVCNAMQYAHDRKVLHRDLKPGNIMLGKYGETLVVDWGLAKAVGKDNPLERSADGELPIVPASGSQSAPTQMGSTLGTPAYMSPEQAEGKLDLLGPPCDIYSLGATLYEILTGQAPLKGLKIPDLLKRVINGDIPLPRTINPHAPPALQAVCRKAMALRPQDRYASAKALAADLEAWLADEPVSAFREPLLARSRRWMRRHPALVSATAASILLTVLGLGGFSSVLAGKNEQLAESNTQLSDSLTREETARKLAEDNEARALAGEALARTNEQRAIAGEELAEKNARDAKRQRDAVKAVNVELTTINKEFTDANAALRLFQDMTLALLAQSSENMAVALKHARKDPQLMTHVLNPLIDSSESVTAEEAEYWKKVIPVMTPEQLAAFFSILARERLKLAEIDRKYEPELNQIGVALLIKRIEEERQKKRASQLSVAPGFVQAIFDLASQAEGSRRLALAGLLLFFGEPDAARAASILLHENAERVPDDGRSRMLLGLYYLGAGQPDTARRWFDEAVLSSPSLESELDELLPRWPSDVAEHDALCIPSGGSFWTGAVIDPETMRIVAVSPFSPATDCGLLLNDQVLGIANAKELTFADFMSAVQTSKGAVIPVNIMRDGLKVVVNVAAERIYATTTHGLEAAIQYIDDNKHRWNAPTTLEILNVLASHTSLRSSQVERIILRAISGSDLDATALHQAFQLLSMFDEDVAALLLQHAIDLRPDDVVIKRSVETLQAKHHQATGFANIKLGAIQDAIDSFRSALEIHERFVQSYPTDAQVQRDLSVSCEELGGLSLQTGAVQEAIAHFRRAHEIRERLAAVDPTDAQAQRDLSVSYNKLGDVSLQTGAVQEAVASYRQALEIRERLAEAAPADAQAHRDLWLSHHKLGEVQRARGQFDAAIEDYHDGVEVLERMIAAGQNVEESQKELAILQSRIELCERLKIATAVWDTLLLLPADELPGLLSLRSTELAKQQRATDVAQAAAKLQELATAATDEPNPDAPERTKSGMLYNAACGYGLCAKLAAGWDGRGAFPPDPLPARTPEQQAERDRFTTLALTALKAAVEAGYDNVEHLQQDTDLAALREHPDYKALLPGVDSTKR